MTTIEELAKAAKTKNATVILDNDITWSPEYTNSSAMEINVAKNVVIDFAGHTINGVKTGALRFFGDFSIMNGTIIGEGDSAGLLINSINNSSGIDYKVETREDHKVTVENMKLVECGMRIELSSVTITNCDVQNSGESGSSNCYYFIGVDAKIEGGKINQTNAPSDTYSRTNCVYTSGNSTININNVVLEGTKRLNAYKNTILFRATNCAGAVTTTPEYVSL